MKRLSLFCFLLPVNILFAQQVKLMNEGVIEFEKTVNMYAIGRKTDLSEQLLKDYQSSHPQFLTFRSTLLFSMDQSLYLPQADARPKAMLNSNIPFPFAGQPNLIFTNFSEGKIINQKNVFDETYLVKDSLRKIKWKLTDEFREIAGLNCRRANGIMLDSIYVVAFYTSKIHVSGGPESFTGLPGMILEVALPHENIIWRAVSIVEGNVPPGKISPPQKGLILNHKQLTEKLRSSMKTISPKNRALLIKDLLI